MANFGAINDDEPPEEPWPTLKISCCMQLLSWLRIATPDPDRSKDTRLLLDMKDVKKLCDHLVRVGLLPDVAAGRFYYALGDAVRLPLWDVMNLPPEMMLTPQVPDATAASAPTTPRRTSLLSSAAKGASAATPKLDAALAVLGSGRKFAAIAAAKAALKKGGDQSIGEDIETPGRNSTHRFSAPEPEEAAKQATPAAASRRASTGGGGSGGGGNTPRSGRRGGTVSDRRLSSARQGGLSKKVDADELLHVWMDNWDGWVDETMQPGFNPVSPRC